MTEHTTESCYFYHELFSFLLLSGLLRHDALEEMVFDPPFPPILFFRFKFGLVRSRVNCTLLNSL